MIEPTHTGAVVRKIRLSLIIAKLPLCFLVAFSSMFGHIFAQQSIDLQSLQIFLAVFFLACGGASFNSYQERHEDRLMKRTQDRPLAMEEITNRHAVVQALLLISLGLLGIFTVSNLKAFVAGVCGIALYNLVYTRMKSWSFHAIVPGAVCGAIPPYIGWLAADGAPVSSGAALVVLLLIFWQIPHFFLVMLNHRIDYSQSISPNMLKYLEEPALQRIFMPWITALAATMITFSTISSPLGIIERFLVVGNAIVLLVVFSCYLFFTKTPNYKVLFHLLNTSLFLFMLTICYSFF